MRQGKRCRRGQKGKTVMLFSRGQSAILSDANIRTSMKLRLTPMTVFLVAIASFHLCSPDSILAQRLYDKERDEQAKEALKLAAAINSHSVFESQLKNLAALAKKDFETEFLRHKLSVNADPLAISNWADAHGYVCRVEGLNSSLGIMPKPEEIASAFSEITTKVEAAKANLAALKQEIKNKEKTLDPELTKLFVRLGDFSSFLELTSEVQKIKEIDAKTLSAINEIKRVIEILQGVYAAYEKVIKDYNRLQEDLGDLRIALKVAAIESLQVDEQHWKNIAAIRARAEFERAEINYMLRRYKGFIGRLVQMEFDPKKKEKFCEVFNAANSPEHNPRYYLLNQSLAESWRELVERARTIEQHNREILRAARATLLKLQNNADDAVMTTALTETIAALDKSILYLQANESLHDFEISIRKKQEQWVKELKETPISQRDKLKKTLLAFMIEGNKLAGSSADNNDNEGGTIRDIVADVPGALYALSSLIARGPIPTRLAELRTAQEIHAYSIRKSAARARAYEKIVSTGATRLALYHQGGIKPEMIAALIHAASNVVIPAAILAK